MSSDTNRNESASNGNVTSAAADGKSVTPPIRDFIYLNQDRIFSYLSQMDGGLKLLYSKVKEESWSETVTTPEKATEVGASAGGTFEGKIPFLAGMSGELGLDLKHAVTTGNDARTDGERRGNAELFGLHHRAFDLVVQRLGLRVKTLSGKILIADINWLERKIKDFPEIMKAANAFQQDKSRHGKAPSNTTQMSYLFRAYLADRILVILRADGGKTFTAYLDPKHLTSSIDTVISDFGHLPTLNFTMVGIEAPPQKFNDAGDFSVTHFQSDAQGMAELFAHFSGSMGNMRDFFEIKSRDGHIVPLALYTEI